MKRIVIIAGDKSGDAYGGLLCKKLKEKFAKVQIYSFGGPHLGEHSQQLIDLLTHSVSGIMEVFSSLSGILRIFNNAVKEIEEIKPDLIIPIDFPDFNLRLIKCLNKKYPVFYYVSPQVWAWRKKRVELIKKYVDKMVVIFEFEKEFYQKEEIQALYFGHPLLEIISPKEVQKKRIVSFLPGSRKNEIKKHLPVMKKTKNLLREDLAGYYFRIIRPANIEKKFYERLSPEMDIVDHSLKAIQESEFIITSSGTATVEIAILGVPFLVMYKVNPLTWHIVKRLVDTRFIAMINILSSKKVVEELLQREANAKNIARKTLQILKDPQAYQKIKKDLEEVRIRLMPYGATEKFAQFIGDYLKLS
ncbi:MAG: lipid-A-disaccharide synthase [Candidatus Omnitrophota bacterium]|nr:MAG: lipid-A-disaccharide synthase [Candidatus Omnitrophota bacterium]